jgi:uncharacterized repeat protein (TIGR02543 family)
MKKITFLITLLFFSLGFMVLSGPMLYATETMKSSYIYDAYTNTHNGVTISIAADTNTITLNGSSSNSSFNLTSLYTPNTRGSSLSTSKSYAVVYEYVSGSMTGTSGVQPIATGSVAYSTSYAGYSVYINTDNYTKTQGYTLLPNDANKNQISLGSGSTFSSFVYRLHFIELTDVKQNDLNMFTSGGTLTSGSLNVTISSGNTVTLSGSVSAETYVDFSSHVNSILKNSDDIYLFTFEFISGTFGSGYNFHPVVFHQSTSRIKFNMSTATQSYSRGIAGSNINVFSVGILSAQTFTDYVYKIHVQKIELYETVIPTPWLITFINEGVEYAIQDVQDQAPAEVPVAPTRAGYNFVNWVLDPLDHLTVFDFQTPITSDLTLYAYWEPNGATIHTITLNSNGGTAVNPITVENGSIASAPTPPIRSGYSFFHWVITGTSTVYDFSSQVTSDLSLTAVWEENGVVFHLITFIENGGSNVTDQIVDDGDLPIEPADPTRSGYLFMGWYSDIALTSIYTFDSAPTADVTLYAKWTPVSGGGDPIAEDPATSGSIWIYVGIGAAALAVLAGSQAKTKKGKRR